MSMFNDIVWIKNDAKCISNAEKVKNYVMRFLQILKQRKGGRTIHFNGDSTNSELLFHTVRSVNQLRVYGAVTSWCYLFGLQEEEKDESHKQLDKDFESDLVQNTTNRR